MSAKNFTADTAAYLICQANNTSFTDSDLIDTLTKNQSYSAEDIKTVDRFMETLCSSPDFYETKEFRAACDELAGLESAPVTAFSPEVAKYITDKVQDALDGLDSADTRCSSLADLIVSLEENSSYTEAELLAIDAVLIEAVEMDDTPASKELDALLAPHNYTSQPEPILQSKRNSSFDPFTYLEIAPKVAAEFNAYAACAAPNEIGGLLKIENIDGQLVATELKVFPQQTTHSTFALDGDAIARFNMELLQEGRKDEISKWCGMIHSHPGFTLHMSGPDIESLEFFCGSKYAFSVIVSTKTRQAHPRHNRWAAYYMQKEPIPLMLDNIGVKGASLYNFLPLEDEDLRAIETRVADICHKQIEDGFLDNLEGNTSSWGTPLGGFSSSYSTPSSEDVRLENSETSYIYELLKSTADSDDSSLLQLLKTGNGGVYSIYIEPLECDRLLVLLQQKQAELQDTESEELPIIEAIGEKLRQKTKVYFIPIKWHNKNKKSKNSKSQRNEADIIRLDKDETIYLHQLLESLESHLVSLLVNGRHGTRSFLFSAEREEMMQELLKKRSTIPKSDDTEQELTLIKQLVSKLNKDQRLHFVPLDQLPESQDERSADLLPLS